PARDKRSHLVLIGEGDLRESLQAKVLTLGLGNRVHFLGVRTDVAAALGAMDVFVLSSDWEGNPLSVMEAMAAGLPIVATTVGGVSELCQNGVEGLLVPPKDSAALARALVRIGASPAMRRAMGAHGKLRAMRHFDVSHMVDGYTELYKQLLRRSRRPVFIRELDPEAVKP